MLTPVRVWLGGRRGHGCPCVAVGHKGPCACCHACSVSARRAWPCPSAACPAKSSLSLAATLASPGPSPPLVRSEAPPHRQHLRERPLKTRRGFPHLRKALGTSIKAFSIAGLCANPAPSLQVWGTRLQSWCFVSHLRC